MKIKKSSLDPGGQHQTRTDVVPVGEGRVRIWHSQSIKQSLNYQSSDATYGMEITVPDTVTGVNKAIVRCEEMVEKYLTAKFKEQRELLEKIAH